MYGLVDCNSFYASCEKVFRPDLAKRPVVVLSNNDGCVIVATPDAKALGLVMGVPYFQAEELIRKNNVAVFSSNYTLYGDLSRRVMQCLSGHARRMEIYSIDEAFLELEEMSYALRLEFGDNLARTVKKWTGITVSIGMAPTKTLAKAANRTAKRRGLRSLKLETETEIDAVLDDMAVDDVWGVFGRLKKKLNRLGITTALELMHLAPARARSLYSVVLERTVRELRGEPCIELEEQPPPKQQIVVSRSFGKLVAELSELEQAVATYAARVGEKLRKQNSFANGVYVWVATNRFREQDKQYTTGISVSLIPATACTADIITAAIAGLRRIYQKGYLFKKGRCYGAGHRECCRGDAAGQPVFPAGEPGKADRTYAGGGQDEPQPWRSGHILCQPGNWRGPANAARYDVSALHDTMGAAAQSEVIAQFLRGIYWHLECHSGNLSFRLTAIPEWRRNGRNGVGMAQEWFIHVFYGDMDVTSRVHPD